MHKTSWLKLAALCAPLPVCAGCGDAAQTGWQPDIVSLAKSPSERVAMEIAGARELEKLRKTKKAIEAYERIAKEFPDSPQAKIASERINALKSSKGSGGARRKS